jgi:hypothetical protein
VLAPVVAGGWSGTHLVQLSRRDARAGKGPDVEVGGHPDLVHLRRRCANKKIYKYVNIDEDHQLPSATCHLPPPPPPPTTTNDEGKLLIVVARGGER